MALRAVGIAAFAALMLWLGCSSWSGAFVPLVRNSPVVTIEPRPALRGVHTAAAHDVGCQNSSWGHAFAVCLAGIGLVLAGRSRRAGSSRSARVVMNYLRRGERYLRPTAKGMKPLINRKIAKDDIKESHETWKKKYRDAGTMEGIMKKTIYGRAQFQFSSNHFTDEMPWLTWGAGGGNRQEEGSGHRHAYDQPFYMRKMLNTAKFKKLELVSWELPDNAPPVVTLDELVRAGVQYGHSSSAWNAKMMPYIYSDFEGTHIFDLVQTSAQLNRACYYAMEAASHGAKFLITGTKEQAAPYVKAVAEACDAYYCDSRFAGGLLTNFKLVRKSVELTKKLRREQEQGAWQILDEERVIRNKMKANRLWRKYKGVVDMTDLPDIMIVVDEVKERNAVAEAAATGIPVIGLCDSNSNPDSIDLPIPGNASGSRSIELILNKLGDAIHRGNLVYESTSVGDRKEFPREFDPWLFSQDRRRKTRKKTKRQPWHKTTFGTYENFKKANPYGYIPRMGEWEEIKWDTRISEGMYNL